VKEIPNRRAQGRDEAQPTVLTSDYLDIWHKKKVYARADNFLRLRNTRSIKLDDPFALSSLFWGEDARAT
jgi:hypothetical protein